MKCKKCGKNNSKNAIFCKKCGQELDIFHECERQKNFTVQMFGRKRKCKHYEEYIEYGPI